MAASARIDELRSKFEANPRRYFAPLANEYRKAGDLGTAIALLRTQLRLFPQHMSGHVVLGQALFEAGELDDARQVFERAVELDAENLIALRHLGDIARELGDAARARSWYQRVLEVDPYNEQISALLHQLTLAPTTRAEPATRDDLEGLTEVAVWPPAIEVHPEAEAPRTPAPEPAPPPEPAPAAEPVDAASEFIDLAEDDFLQWAPPAAEVDPEPETPAAAPEPAPSAPRLDPVDAATFDPVVGLDLVPLHDEAFEQLEHVEESTPPAAAEPWIPEEGAPLELVTSDTFATETMAELCLEQGHEEEALAIYERLIAQRPDDADLAERARTLRERLHPAAEVPAPPPPSPPSPPSTPRAPTPTVAPHMEERDAWAANAWASALRADAPSAEPLLPDLSFDRFFEGATFVEEPTAAVAPPAPEPEPAPAPSPPAPASAPAGEEEDLAEFNAWLKGLRDS